MFPLSLTAGALALVTTAFAADNRKEVRLDVAPGATINIVNSAGSVNLHSDNGRQLQLVYTTHSDKVEVDQNSTADKKRIEIVTHALPQQKPSAEEARVDYDITVPSGVSVTVTTATAPITADGLRGDITLASDTGQITARNISRSHVAIRSVAAPVNMNNMLLDYVDVTSSGGAVQMVNVAGPKVSVGTASGNITYEGDCSGGGAYNLSTHSGAIDVTLPQTASVDLSARSVSGKVENEFPLQQKPHTSFVPQTGRSFAGTSNSGSSSIELQSFSGRIRVKKQ